MFYDTRKNDHGLRRDPIKAIVAPRPIGWISSMSKQGALNLAPYSFFNMVSSRPPMVMYSNEERKDTLSFIEETGEFVCNLATNALRQAVVETGEPFARGVNEMEVVGLTPAPSRLVRAPRVAESPCALECRLSQVVQLRDAEGRPIERYVVIGHVVGVHIEDRFLKEGKLDSAAMQSLARCGYSDYSMVERTFPLRATLTDAQTKAATPAAE